MIQHSFGLKVPGAVITSRKNCSVVVRLSGNIPELGSWAIDQSPSLTLLTTEFHSAQELLNEPRFYRLDIDLPETIFEFEYKYVIGDEIWEGNWNHNRQWKRDNQMNLIDRVYYTPIDYWLNVDSGVTDESAQTTNFYREIVGHQILHYGRVTDHLFVGSCPRLRTHIDKDLREKLGITAVINLQVLGDIEKNCQGIISNNQQAIAKKDKYDLSSVAGLRQAYEEAGIVFIWMPTTDMSSTGRELSLPQATLALKTMLDKGHTIYVHCNAGVGRAFGLICAYYHLVLNVPLSIVEYQLAPIRSCGYFDKVFLENAKSLYNKAFGQ